MSARFWKRKKLIIKVCLGIPGFPGKWSRHQTLDTTPWHRVWISGAIVWRQELNSVILVGPFQFGIVYDSMILHNGSSGTLSFILVQSLIFLLLLPSVSQAALLQLPFEYVVKSQTLKTEDSLLASLQVVSPAANIDLGAPTSCRSRSKGFAFPVSPMFYPCCCFM